MLFPCLLSAAAARVHGQELVFTQMIWRHGLRTPINTYANDPYDEAFFGVPEGKGMEQHFVRGQQLRKRYVEDLKLVSEKYSRYEFNIGNNVPDWPSAWTPIPIHTVPHDDDYILEAFDICPRLFKLEADRMQRTEFQNFLSSNWPIFHTINVNSGNPVDYSFGAIAQMFQSLSIEKDCNLTLPDWVTDEFYNDLEAANNAGYDYCFGEGGFGLPMYPEMTKLISGFLLKDWMDNIAAVINGTSTLKYYAYSGVTNLIGPGNADYASTIAYELWKNDQQYFIKLLVSPNIDSAFEPFTSKLSGCGTDLCPLSEFKKFIQPFIADDVKVCV